MEEDGDVNLQKNQEGRDNCALSRLPASASGKMKFLDFLN